MLNPKDLKNLKGVSRLARINSKNCNSCVEVANAVEGVMVAFALREHDEALDGLHVANAHLGGVADLTVRVPIRQIVMEMIERVEDSNDFDSF